MFKNKRADTRQPSHVVHAVSVEYFACHIALLPLEYQMVASIPPNAFKFAALVMDAVYFRFEVVTKAVDKVKLFHDSR